MGYAKAMVRFAPPDVIDDETPAAEPRGEAPVTRGRWTRRLAAPSSAPTNPLLEQAFPSWARPPKQPVVGADAAFRAGAGAGLALLDTTLRENPPFGGALRQRLALQAAVSCAKMARLREDASNLRDAEHLAPVGGETSPAGRIHRLWRLFATRPPRLDAAALTAAAAELLDLRTAEPTLAGLAAALREILARAGSPLATAAGASRAAMVVLAEAAPVEAEILAFWLADLTLAQRLSWRAPIPLLAVSML